MAYNLEKMQLPDIRMLFEVLEEIRKTCSSRDNAFLVLDKKRRTKNVSEQDFIHIIGTLHREGYLKRYGILTAFLGTSFRVITKKFEPFYLEVAKRQNILEQKDSVAQKISGEDLSLDFNSQKSILYFRNFEIKITLKNDKPNAHYILDYIFNDEEGLGKEFPFSEISEDKFKDDYDAGNYWRKCYRACEDIQEKVRKESGIEDFLIFTSGKTGWVKINEKYLE